MLGALMALHNFSLLHPAILIRYAFCPHIVYTRVEIMHLYAVETCRSIRRRQRLSIEKGGQRIISLGEPRCQITGPLEPQGLTPQLYDNDRVFRQFCPMPIISALRAL